MAEILKFTKHPADKLDFVVHWADWLPDGDAISTSEFDHDGADLLITDQDIAGTDTVVWLDGGISGVTYHLTHRITTTGGRETTRRIAVEVDNKR